MVAAAAVLPFTLNTYDVFILANIALLATVGIGLNLLIGLIGQISFGHVGFYAIGAYTVAILTTKAGWSFWAAWPVAAVLAGACGALLALPALRARGPYLAMITIAFGFIVEQGIVEMRGLTGGQNGIMGLAAPPFDGAPFAAAGEWIGSLGGRTGGERTIAVLALLLAAVALLLYRRIDRGTWGAAMRAVRDSETAAESIGIAPLVVKTVAFAGSAVAAGAAGALFAPLSGFVTPHTFGFMQSILFVLAVMIGGAGSITGPVLGAIIVGLLPELLAGVEEYRLMLFGALLLVVLWAVPGGASGLIDATAKRLRHGWGGGRQPGGTDMRIPAPEVPDPQVPAGLSARGPGVTALPAGTGAPPALVAEHFEMRFGGVRAVDDLSFTVQPRRITSLIGPNGAGKSTVLNLLTGFYRPSAGTARLGDTPLTGRPAFRIARAGIARSYQTSQLFTGLSAEDNVALGAVRGRLGPLLGAAALRAPAVRDAARAALRFCGFETDPATPAADLPHVDRRLVEIARALATCPAMLLLDEPAAGLSREDKTRLASLLRRIADAGIGVLLVEHDMALVMGISDEVIVLESGRFLAAGTPGEVRADPNVLRAYLGESAPPAASPHAGPAAGTRIAPDEHVTATPAVPSTGATAPRGQELLGVGTLTAGYGAAPVLHDVDLAVREGETVALLGANGAGKSTLMRALAGLHRPVAGGIHLAGQSIAALPAERIVALGMVLVPEGRQGFPELSVLDNLRLGGFLAGTGREALAEAMLVRFPRLRDRLQQRAGLLSGGEQQMLAIARGLMARPKLLLLDEPSLGLAPKVIAELFDALDALRRERMTLLLVDQMAGLTLALADRAYVIEEGRIVARGDAASIAADDRLASAYLGAAAPSPALPAAVPSP